MDTSKRILLSYPHMSGDEEKCVHQAFLSNWIAPLGPMVEEFERNCSECTGMEYALATCSGSAAIHLALRLLGIGRGDRVLCSDLTFIASAAPAVYQEAEMVFVDSDPQSWNMSPVALRRALEDSRREGRPVKAVIVAELYGQCPDMEAIGTLCREYGVPIMEDAAEALGSTFNGRPCGSFGDVSVLSFNGNKIITTSGGGMLLVHNKAQRDKAFFWATQARDKAPWYQHTEVGYNYRMSNILAAVGVGQFKHLAERVAARRRIYFRYAGALKDLPLQMMPIQPGCVGNMWLSCITIRPGTGKTFMDLYNHLNERNIESRPIWKPMHLQPIFQGCRYYPCSLEHSVSDEIFGSGLCLPSCSAMSDAEQDRVVEALHEVFSV